GGRQYTWAPSHGTSPATRSPDRRRGARARQETRAVRAAPARATGSGRDDDGADDLVGERLALGVPEREQPADVAGEGIEDVADVAGEGHAAADRLTGVLADEAEIE